MVRADLPFYSPRTERLVGDICRAEAKSRDHHTVSEFMTLPRHWPPPVLSGCWAPSQGVSSSGEPRAGIKWQDRHATPKRLRYGHPDAPRGPRALAVSGAICKTACSMESAGQLLVGLHHGSETCRYESSCANRVVLIWKVICLRHAMLSNWQWPYASSSQSRMLRTGATVARCGAKLRGTSVSLAFVNLLRHDVLLE